MCTKRKRSSDGLSYDLCFKGFGFLIISIVLIRIVATISNRKPLNPNPKVDQQSWTPTSFRSWILPRGSMGSFEIR
jgi:hypothetical protein